jgi:hypothetical protein
VTPKDIRLDLNLFFIIINMKIDKYYLMETLVKHGKIIERLECIAEKIRENEKRISEDEDFRDKIVMDFQRIVYELTHDNYLDIISKSNFLILQSIVSKRIEIDGISDLFRWLLENWIREASGLACCLAYMLDEPCGQIIYSRLLSEDVESIPREVERHLKDEEEAVKVGQRRRRECLEKKILDEYVEYLKQTNSSKF